jgi:hypothetical protein
MWTANGFIAVTLDAVASLSAPSLVVGQKVNVTGIATGSQLWATSVATAPSDN